MKRFVMMMCGVWISVSALAQLASEKLILPIATDKTTSLIFPFAIKYVDRGTKEVLAQQVPEAENLLLVKAASANFKTTNLSVVIADGRVFSFEVRYHDNPLKTVFDIVVPGSLVPNEVTFQGELMNARDMETYCKGIVDNSKFIRGVRNNKWDITGRVIGIYLKDDLIFYHLKLENASPISYGIDFIRFYIRDKRKGKRTATQEIELPVLFKTGNMQKVEAISENYLAFALEKFTIPDAKLFIIEIGEKNGGRHLRLKISNRKLLKARLLPSYK